MMNRFKEFFGNISIFQKRVEREIEAKGIKPTEGVKKLELSRQVLRNTVIVVLIIICLVFGGLTYFKNKNNPTPPSATATKKISEKQRGDGQNGHYCHLPEILGFNKGRPPARFVRTDSYTLDYLVSGLQPWGYHLFNLLYHLATTLLVYALARRLLAGSPAALLVALLFAVHPVHTEAVTYISGRRDLLSTLLTLAGVLTYLRYREAPTRGRALGLGALYGLALFAKEMAITLPLLCLAYEAVQPAPGPGLRGALRALGQGTLAGLRRFPVLYGSLFALAGGFAFYLVVIAKATAKVGWWGGHVLFNFLTVARIWVHHLQLLVFPKTLLVDYSYNAFPVTNTLGDWRGWGAVLLLGLLALGLLRLLAVSRIAAFGGLWFALALLPVSHIIPHHELMAEHHLYLPSVGLFLLVGWAASVAWAQAAWRGPVLAAAVLVLLRSEEHTSELQSPTNL